MLYEVITRRDLEKDEEIEGVAGDRYAQHPGEAQQVHDVEQRNNFV